MVSHIRYSEQKYTDPGACLAAIGLFLSRGWWVSSVEGPTHGSYTVVFGVDDEPESAAG
jgi:hypothetical protein